MSSFLYSYAWYIDINIFKVDSSCVIISEDESDTNRGETVLQYYSGNSVLRDTMKSGSVVGISSFV